MDVSYLLCDLRSGRFLTELPLTVGDKIRKVIGREETLALTLPVVDKSCPTNWANLLVDGKSMILPTLDGSLVQGYAVIDHVTGDVTVPITGTTLEHCLKRTNVPDLDPTGLDQSQVAALLCAEMPARFGFLVDWEPCGKTDPGDAEYSTLEDRSILDALNALQAGDGGPEWRIVVDWADDTHRVVTKTIQIRPRIGTYRPDAVLDLDADGGGFLESYRRTSSYAEGKGATMLIGTSEGSGASRPMTDPMVSPVVDSGFPIWEERKNFTGLGQGDVDEDTELASRTAATLTQRESGTVTWVVTTRGGVLVPGVDFDEGDTLPVKVAPRPPVDPIGGSTLMRCLGWEIDPASGQVDPMVWDDGSDTSG